MSAKILDGLTRNQRHYRKAKLLEPSASTERVRAWREENRERDQANTRASYARNRAWLEDGPDTRQRTRASLGGPGGPGGPVVYTQSIGRRQGRSEHGREQGRHPTASDGGVVAAAAGVAVVVLLRRAGVLMNRKPQNLNLETL